MPLYYRFLKAQLDNGKERVSSQEVSEALHLDPATVRKDFSNLGDFGRRGYGYDVAYLKQFIAHLLYQDQPVQMVFIGSLHFYQVLCENQFMLDEGYEVTAIFTTSIQELINNDNSFPVYSIDDLASYAATHAVDIAILATSGEVQDAAEVVVQAGIRSILNCTAKYIQLPGDVDVQHLDIIGELHSLHLRRIYAQ